MIQEDTLHYLIPRLRETIVCGRKIFLYLDNADYTVACLDAATKSPARVSIVAVFRENYLGSDGSWWQQWYANCGQTDSALFTAFVARQINQSIARFSWILEENSKIQEPQELDVRRNT